MYEGGIRVSGTVSELVWSEDVAESTSVPRSPPGCAGATRVRPRNGALLIGARVHEPVRQALPEPAAQAGDEDQPSPLSGDGVALHAAARPPAAPQAGTGRKPVPRSLPRPTRTRRSSSRTSRTEGGERKGQKKSTGKRSSWRASTPEGGVPVRGARVLPAVSRGVEGLAPTTSWISSECSTCRSATSGWVRRSSAT